MSVPLRSLKSLVWKVDGKVLGKGEKIFWTPGKPGDYTIEAYEEGGTEVSTLHIHVIQ
jgi:membrane carboxypeptidase/penicillin-binding protein PbpC